MGRRLCSLRKLASWRRFMRSRFLFRPGSTTLPPAGFPMRGNCPITDEQGNEPLPRLRVLLGRFGSGGEGLDLFAAGSRSTEEPLKERSRSRLAGVLIAHVLMRGLFGLLPRRREPRRRNGHLLLGA